MITWKVHRYVLDFLILIMTTTQTATCSQSTSQARAGSRLSRWDILVGIADCPRKLLIPILLPGCAHKWACMAFFSGCARGTPIAAMASSKLTYGKYQVLSLVRKSFSFTMVSIHQLKTTVYFNKWIKKKSYLDYEKNYWGIKNKS